MFLFEHAETTITLTPTDDGTQATFESQFEIPGRLNFAEGFAARMVKKRIESNLNAAKRILEARYLTNQ
jgi:hypothetical protein